MTLPCVAVIELACGEYGQEKVDKMVEGTDNGRCLSWFVPDGVKDSKTKGTNILFPHVITNNT
jgi:hypothetical protein